MQYVWQIKWTHTVCQIGIALNLQIPYEWGIIFISILHIYKYSTEDKV